jgi:hypothetical protein
MVETSPQRRVWLHVIGAARDAVLSRPQAHNTLIAYQNFWQAPEVFPTLVIRPVSTQASSWRRCATSFDEAAAFTRFASTH